MIVSRDAVGLAYASCSRVRRSVGRQAVRGALPQCRAMPHSRGRVAYVDGEEASKMVKGMEDCEMLVGGKEVVIWGG